MNDSKLNRMSKTPISFLDFPELIFSARHGIPITPEQVADRHRLYVERSFSDQLGVYVFVGFESGGYQFGLRRYLDSPNKEYSNVSLSALEHDKKAALISKVLDVDISQIIEYDEEW